MKSSARVVYFCVLPSIVAICCTLIWNILKDDRQLRSATQPQPAVIVNQATSQRRADASSVVSGHKKRSVQNLLKEIEKIRDLSENPNSVSDLESLVEEFSESLTDRESATLAKHLIVNFQHTQLDWSGIIIARWSESEPLLVLETIREQILRVQELNAEEFEQELKNNDGGIVIESMFPINPPPWRDGRFAFFASAYEGWARVDSKAAWEHLQTLGEIKHGDSDSAWAFNDSTVAIFESLASVHPELALVGLESSKSNIANRLLKAFAEELPPSYDFFTAAERLRDFQRESSGSYDSHGNLPLTRGPGPDFFIRWMTEDSAEALQWYTSFNQEMENNNHTEGFASINQSVSELLTAWTYQHPEDAIPWLQQNMTAERADMVRQTLKHGLFYLSDSHKDQILKIAKNLPNTDQRFKFLEIAANPYPDPFDDADTTQEGAQLDKEIILKHLPAFALPRDQEKKIQQILNARER